MDGDGKNSDYKIWNTLKISFDNLKVEEMNKFLDTCYFFCNDVYLDCMLKEKTLKIWTNNKKKILEEEVEFIFDILINKSLVKIDNDRIMRAHVQL